MTSLPTTAPVALALIVAGASATWLAASGFEAGFDRGVDRGTRSDPGSVPRSGPPQDCGADGAALRAGPAQRPVRVAAPIESRSPRLATPKDTGEAGAAESEVALEEARIASLSAEIAELLSRMDSSLALFDEPTPEALAQWHAGRSLADLAGAVHDAQEATSWLGARRIAPERFAAHGSIDAPLARLAERAATLEVERVWLYREIDRRVTSPSTLGSQHLHRHDGDALERMFPTARDRYVLATLLNQEAHEIGRASARHQIDAQRLAALAGLAQQKESRFSLG